MLHGDIGAPRPASYPSVFLSAGVRNAVRLFGVALAALTVAACAQSPLVASRPGPAVGWQASSERHLAWPKRPAVAASERGGGATNVLGGASHIPSNGLASYYSSGARTANGETFEPQELTAAHPTLPFGTRLRVTNASTGQSVVVRVNDRGPFVPGRTVDVSYAAAERLGMVKQGVARVKMDVIQ
jgi:rare lipoprotein A